MQSNYPAFLDFQRNARTLSDPLARATSPKGRGKRLFRHTAERIGRYAPLTVLWMHGKCGIFCYLQQGGNDLGQIFGKGCVASGGQVQIVHGVEFAAHGLRIQKMGADEAALFPVVVGQHL